MRAAEGMGLVAIRIRPGRGSGRNTNEYRLSIPPDFRPNLIKGGNRQSTAESYGATGSALPNGQPAVERRATGSGTSGNRQSTAADPPVEPQKNHYIPVESPVSTAGGRASQGRVNGHDTLADNPPHGISRIHWMVITTYRSILVPPLSDIETSRWRGSSTGEKALAARIKEHTRHREPSFWQGFFEAVKANKHWMGTNDREWRADLRWLLKRENFDKVIDHALNARG